MNEVTWERRECVSAEVEQSLVLLDLDTLLYHSLNSTAAAMWELLAEPHSAAEITDGLCQRYQVTPEVCRAAVDRTLTRFKDAGLIAAKSNVGAVSAAV